MYFRNDSTTAAYDRVFSIMKQYKNRAKGRKFVFEIQKIDQILLLACLGSDFVLTMLSRFERFDLTAGKSVTNRLAEYNTLRLVKAEHPMNVSNYKSFACQIDITQK